MRPYAWLRRASQIAEALSDEPSLLDRERVEQLFQIPRRTAIDLLHAAGAEKKGRAFVIPRERLVRFVSEQMGNAPPRRPESGFLLEKKSPDPRPGQDERRWVQRTADGVTLVCSSAADLVRNLRRLTSDLQDPARRQALLAELGLR